MASGEYVTIEYAGQATGVPARTRRRWDAVGKVAVMAGHMAESVDEGEQSDPRIVTSPPVVVAAAVVAQLDAIRDHWLRPLLEQHEALARAVERLEAERDALAAARERDTAQAEQLVDLLERGPRSRAVLPSWRRPEMPL